MDMNAIEPQHIIERDRMHTIRIELAAHCLDAKSKRANA